jgi:hypothetical protein
MAKKDKNTYEITREKPTGSFGLLISGGAAGSVFLFLVTLLIGAYAGITLDNLIFYFLLSGFAGFLLGAGMTWILIRYFGEIIHFSSLVGSTAASASSNAPEPEPQMEAESPIEEGSEEKGKSVDYVFPEFSPENQS